MMSFFRVPQTCALCMSASHNEPDCFDGDRAFLFILSWELPFGLGWRTHPALWDVCGTGWRQVALVNADRSILRRTHRSPRRTMCAPPAHQGKLKFTSTVVTTSTGVPLSKVGLYSHCLTASVADCTNRG